MAFTVAINKPELSEIIKQLIAYQGITVTELARRVTLPQPTIQRITSGAYKQPRNNTLQPIADYFGISLEQLRGLAPIPFLSCHKKIIKGIPLLNMTNLLTWPTVSNNISQHVICDNPLSAQAFAMYMPDASMSPVIPKGATLLVDPERHPHHGSFIVLKRQHHADIIIRQLITDTTNRFIKALSIDLAHLKMNLLDHTDTILGVVIEVRLNCE